MNVLYSKWYRKKLLFTSIIKPVISYHEGHWWWFHTIPENFNSLLDPLFSLQRHPRLTVPHASSSLLSSPSAASHWLILENYQATSSSVNTAKSTLGYNLWIVFSVLQLARISLLGLVFINTVTSESYNFVLCRANEERFFSCLVFMHLWGHKKQIFLHSADGHGKYYL